MKIKTKNRMTVFDVKSIVLDLKAVAVGLWVHNIYNLSQRSFQFKLSTPGADKVLLLVEAGVRLHTTEYSRKKDEFPSGFAMKLRKHIRGKKLSDVSQIGFDRVVLLTFGYEKNLNYLIVELYSSGNVVLTDAEFTILSVLRVHDFGDESKVAVREKYPFKATVANLVDLEANSFNIIYTLKKAFQSYRQHLEEKRSNKRSIKKLIEQKTVSLTDLLSLQDSPFSTFGKSIIIHFLLEFECDPELALDVASLMSDSDTINSSSEVADFDRVFCAMKSARNFLMEEKHEPGSGYIVLESSADQSVGNYVSFEPLKLNQQRSDDRLVIKELKSFNAAVDLFFSKVDSQKSKKQEEAAARVAEKKVDKVKKEQQQRVQNLENDVKKNQRIAETIMENFQVVDKAIESVNVSKQNKLSWQELDHLLKMERVKDNPVAKAIEKVELDKDVIVFRFDDLVFTVDIKLSVHANARKYFESRKNSERKVEKTQEVSVKLIKVAESKAQEQLEVQKEKIRKQLDVSRKTYWFEKFYWFITKHGFIVLSGRDAQQNELLVKKYLRPDFKDLFVHADFHGASACIIRNKRKDVSIDMESIVEACSFAVCRSKAWDTKILANAYYVNADQVSKTAQSGEYLSTGSFMVRGKKNFVTTRRLELGFGYIFKLDETQPSFSDRETEWKSLDLGSIDERDFIDKTSSATDLYDEKTDPLEYDIIKSTFREKTKTETRFKEKVEKPKPKTKGNELPRGKRGKLKKMKKKYRNQTEEDRALAMLRIGHKPVEVEDNVSEVQRTVDLRSESKSLSKEDSSTSKTVNKSKPSDDVKNNSDVNLKQFTAHPKVDDSILFGIPVCAPLSSLSHFKYKVKIVPGTLKKGKAAKLAREVLLKNTLITEREKLLIRNVEDNQSIQAMIGNAKVSAPGVRKLINQKKKKKRAK